jgi:hypothetical protein
MSRDIFGPAPILGEDAKAYDELLTGVSTAVGPVDMIEQIFVRDVVDNSWDIIRWRRLRVQLMKANAYKGVSETLAPSLGSARAQDLATAWATRTSDAVEMISKALDCAGLGIDAVMAQTLALNLAEVERIDRLISVAEARRNATLREIARHRDTLAQKLLRAVQQLETNELPALESA